ncbi:MAG: hypothetical protein FJ095_07950 [Deltaproteobacteria bacterium]|nr:hypothetical protein [Deltaproteobacteria bacterium]
MTQSPRLCSWLLGALLAALPVTTGCTSDTGSSSDDVTDVKHTDVERQSIGNCWLYAHASWIESMNFSATGKAFDVSQSYWTYWDWFNKIVGGEVYSGELETGGFYYVANDIVLERGIMPEAKFIKEDSNGEMSSAQSSALKILNEELKTGRLKTADSRYDRALVRTVLDDAWKLTPTVKSQLTKVFGKNYERSFLSSSTTTSGSSVVHPKDFKVWYTERTTNKNQPTERITGLDVAINQWRVASYPSWSDSSKRDLQIRVQKALHDRQPVIITWDVDFNAMEGQDPVLKGSFNMTTLKKAVRPGRQGGHMTVLEDYEVETKDFGLLKAGVTLDPKNAEDAKKLAAALLPTSSLKFLRIKNSWGAFRDDRSSAPGFPGYHDLYMDYLNGPIAWCPDAADPKDPAKCTGRSTPWDSVVLPPGY